MAEHGGGHARSPLTELTLARLRELIREPEAVFWVFIFPVLLAGILGVASAAVRPMRCPWRWWPVLMATSAWRHCLHRPSSSPACLTRPRRGRRWPAARWCSSCRRTISDLRLRSHPAREPSRAAGRRRGVAARRGARGRLHPRHVEVTEPGTRYVDFLVPGLLGMNLMGTGMWGIASRSWWRARATCSSAWSPRPRGAATSWARSSSRA